VQEDLPDRSLLPRLSRLTAGTGGLRLTLAPLGVADTGALVSSMLAGERVSDEFAGFIHGLTEGVPFAVDGQTVVCHPTQIYESVFHLTMAGVLLLLMRTGLLRNHLLQLYLICYGVYRFLTEFIRPEPGWVLGLTFYQCAAVFLVVGLAAQWIVDDWLVGRIVHKPGAPATGRPVAGAPGL